MKITNEEIQCYFKVQLKFLKLIHTLNPLTKL